MNLQDEIKKAKELLSQLEEKHAGELEKPKSKRILVDGLDCHFVSPVGSVFDNEDSSSLTDNDNAFIDKESAQLQAQRNTLVYKMRVDALECPVDWSNFEKKYYPTWKFNQCGELFFHHSNFIRVSQLPHFASKSKLEIFMNSLSADEQKLLICGVE